MSCSLRMHLYLQIVSAIEPSGPYQCMIVCKQNFRALE